MEVPSVGSGANPIDAWLAKVLVRYHLRYLEGVLATIDGKLLLDSRSAKELKIPHVDFYLR